MLLSKAFYIIVAKRYFSETSYLIKLYDLIRSLQILQTVLPQISFNCSSKHVVLNQTISPFSNHLLLGNVMIWLEGSLLSHS